MTPRDEIRAYLEKLKALGRDYDEIADIVARGDAALESNYNNAIAANLRSLKKRKALLGEELDSALRNAFPLLLEMAERALECDGCQGSGLRFPLWMNPVINEPCPSCTPRVTRWAEQIEGK